MQFVNAAQTQNPGNLGGPPWVVVIAAGTGGPQALAQVLPRFPANFLGTVIVVQHMRQGFTRVLADQLNHICQLPIHEPSDGQILQASRILMVPGGTALTIERADSTQDSPRLVFLESVAGSPDQMRTRADSVMASAVSSFGKSTIGVLLTGVGCDGCEGLRHISQTGGLTMVQDEPTCVVHDLPASAIRAGHAHEVLPLWSIADRIIETVMGDTNAVAA